MSYHPNYSVLISDFLTLEVQYGKQKISHEIIGHSVNGTAIYMFKIGKNPYAGRVMMDGSMHGGEWVGPELYWLYAKWLLENQEPGLSDRILEKNYTLIIPSTNPDSHDLKKRTNARGVNLNRNFPKSWRTDCAIQGTPDATGACPAGQQKIGPYCYKSGCACGWDDVVNSGAYRGPAPGSEPETQAILAALRKWQPKFYLNSHTWDPAREFARPSSRAGLTVKDATYHQYVFNKCLALAEARGVVGGSFGPFPGYMQSGVCGGLIDDAYATGHATSFLIEWLSVDDCGGYTNPPYSTILDVCFPQFLPVAITFSQECEGIYAPSPLPLIIVGGVILYLILKGR
jgi:hypothetical protein